MLSGPGPGSHTYGVASAWLRYEGCEREWDAVHDAIAVERSAAEPGLPRMLAQTEWTFMQSSPKTARSSCGPAGTASPQQPSMVTLVCRSTQLSSQPWAKRLSGRKTKRGSSYLQDHSAGCQQKIQYERATSRISRSAAAGQARVDMGSSSGRRYDGPAV